MEFEYSPSLDDPLFRPIYLHKIDPKFTDVEEFECSVFEVFKKMKEFEIDLNYVRTETPRIRKYVKTTSRSSAPTSGGRDVYRCRHYQKGCITNEKVIRVGDRSETHCSASFTIHYPYGYMHEDIPGVGKKMNLRDHGNAKVRVSWRSKHNHMFNSQKEFASAPLSREAYNSLQSLISIGFDWKKIEMIQARELVKNHPFQQEISKVKAETIRNMRKKASFPLLMRGKKVRENLDTVISSVRSSGGFAELTTVFYSFDEPRVRMEHYQTNAGNEIFSLILMTAWQKEMLKRNEKVFLLDSTHKTSTGLFNNEDAYLFTVYVKNQVTGQGAPAAFMLTNGERGPVIADFLQKIKDFSQFEPSQALIDCSQAEKNAIEYVWNGVLPIVYCRFHVKRAFSRKVSDKIYSVDKSAVVGQATLDFYEIINCKNMPEADEKIEAFLRKFRAHTDLISYMATEWFSQKQLIVDGSYETFVEGASTNNPIESFHSVLKKKILGDAKRLGMDLWSHRLLDEVLILYMGRERRSELMFQERTHDKAELKALEKVGKLSKERLMGLATSIGGGKFVVKSFSDLYKAYIVNHRIAGSRKDSCESPAFNNSGSWCKHLFAVEKWWKIYLTLRRDETDIDVPGLGFERETNSTTDNGIDVDKTNVLEFDDTTTISPSENTNSHTPAEDASQNEVIELDEPAIMLRKGPVDNHYRGYDVFEEHAWVRITNNPQSGNREPALVDIDRQNMIRRDIAQTNKRLYREAVDTKWEEAVKKACRFRNSIGRNDQYIAFSNELISLIDSHIKKFENPRACQR